MLLVTQGQLTLFHSPFHYAALFCLPSARPPLDSGANSLSPVDCLDRAIGIIGKAVGDGLGLATIHHLGVSAMQYHAPSPLTPASSAKHHSQASTSHQPPPEGHLPNQGIRVGVVEGRHRHQAGTDNARQLHYIYYR